MQCSAADGAGWLVAPDHDMLNVSAAESKGRGAQLEGAEGRGGPGLVAAASASKAGWWSVPALDYSYTVLHAFHIV